MDKLPKLTKTQARVISTVCAIVLIVLCIVMMFRVNGTSTPLIISIVVIGAIDLYAMMQSYDIRMQEQREQRERERERRELEGAYPYLVVLCFPNNLVYQVFDGGDAYQLVHVGSDLAPVNPKRLLHDAPSAAAAQEISRKSFSIAKQDIQKVLLSGEKSSWTARPQYGQLQIDTTQKTWKLVLMGEAEDYVKPAEFFASLGDAFSRR